MDPDKKVENLKAKRPSVYQSTQHPKHFENEGSEYDNIRTEENNDISTNADYEKGQGIKIKKEQKEKQLNAKEVNKNNNIITDNSNELRSADDPKGGENSGIPGTGMKADIGTPASEAGLGRNKGKGTSNFPNRGVE